MKHLKFTKGLISLTIALAFLMLYLSSNEEEWMIEIAAIIFLSLPVLVFGIFISACIENAIRSFCRKNKKTGTHEFTDWYLKESSPGHYDNEEWEQKHCIHCGKIITREIPHYAELEK